MMGYCAGQMRKVPGKNVPKLLQAAENLLITEEAPIVPVYFYKGFNFFDPGRIDGLYQNILDEHPIQMLRKLR